MRIVQAPRASAILYHVLASREQKKPWLLPANICPIVPITFLKARVPFELVDISAETLRTILCTYLWGAIYSNRILRWN